MGKALLERFARDPLHCDIGQRPVAADFIDRNDVGMFDRRRCFSFGYEPLAGSFAQRRPQNFNHNVAVELRIDAAIDDTRAARTDQLHQPEMRHRSKVSCLARLTQQILHFRALARRDAKRLRLLRRSIGNRPAFGIMHHLLKQSAIVAGLIGFKLLR